MNEKSALRYAKQAKDHMKTMSTVPPTIVAQIDQEEANWRANCDHFGITPEDSALGALMALNQIWQAFEVSESLDQFAGSVLAVTWAMADRLQNILDPARIRS